MKPNQLQDLFEETIYQVLGEKEFSEHDLERMTDNFEKKLPGVVERTAKMICDSLDKRMASMLRERRAIRKGFEKRHFRLWRKGLDLLEAYLVVALEVGESFNNYYRSEASQVQDHLFDALTRLHARAIHVGYEVLCLLGSGFADGAHARWRTAHEIAVVSNFLALHGQETAKRYLEHGMVESYKAMLEFQKHAEALGQARLADDIVREIEAERDRLCAQYGREFADQYGWATGVMSGRKPNFSDIEKESRLDHLRPYYRMASHNVHANPKGIGFRLGLSEGSELLLAGPSNYGLADPARGTAMSVLQATFPMLTSRPNMDSLVMSRIMESYVDNIDTAFSDVETTMEDKETAQH